MPAPSYLFVRSMNKAGSREVPAMRICKKRCQYCHRWFTPDKRKVNIQMTCLDPECQRKRQAETSREWWSNPDNPPTYQQRRTKIVAWAKEQKYWQKRRKKDKEYRKKDNQRRKEARRAAKQISIDPVFRRGEGGGLPPEGLFQAWGAAKQISIRRGLETSIMGP